MNIHPGNVDGVTRASVDGRPVSLTRHPAADDTRNLPYQLGCHYSPALAQFLSALYDAEWDVRANLKQIYGDQRYYKYR